MGNDAASNDKKKTIAFGAVAPHRTARAVYSLLSHEGYDIVDVSLSAHSHPMWPSVGQRVAQLVAGGSAITGVALCWTGSGVSISASTVEGTRAAFCSSPSEASEARAWHDANLLALALPISDQLALDTVRAWLAATPSRSSEHIAAREELAAITATA